jgi:hypothetical protein
VDKDERPDPEKMVSLVREIRRKLRRMSPRYDQIISYINVKSYWTALDQIRDEFHIQMLPRLYDKHKVWNSKKLHMGPIGVFKTEIHDLIGEMDKLVNVK